MEDYEQKHDEVFIAPHRTAFDIEEVLSGRLDKDFKYVWEYAKLAAAIYNNDSHQFNSHSWAACSTEFKTEPNGRIHPSGLKVQAWKKLSTDKKSVFVTIVFRGTHGKVNDWLFGNFHWIFRFLPCIDTYYEQVMNNIDRFIKDTLTDIQPSQEQKVFLISAGHSLGGGLAQCAAYAVEKIKLCYVFDSSPVTAYFSVKKKMRKKSCEDLRIYRVYEDREVLGYVRYFTQLSYKLNRNFKNTDPKFVEAKFNLNESGSILSNHCINNLANGLEMAAVKYGLIDLPEPVLANDDVSANK